jgi:glycosyltransferase involved in cell wall biosynthesis
VRLVGSVLVRNEDVYIERAVRNVAAVCDRIHVLDHMSDDRTPEILRALGEQFDHLDVERSTSSEASHRQLQQYVGTDTWVLGVDGDELFDPAGLQELRARLEAGGFADVFRVKAHVLNCDELDLEAGAASGFLAPPGRPVTKLYNFAGVTSWPWSPQRLLGADPEFRPGFHPESTAWLSSTTDWDGDPLRLLHVCFLRRSSLDGENFAAGRRSLGDSLRREDGLRGRLRRLVRRSDVDPSGVNWKQEWYRLGERVTVDAKPFFPGGMS